MKVTFIRHVLPSFPYDDYSKLSMNQLDDLALDIVDPHVKPNQEEKIGRSLKKLRAISKDTIIVHSPNIRTRETSQIVKKVFEQNYKTTSLMEIDDLKEVFFHPSKIVDLNSKKDVNAISLLRGGIQKNLFSESGQNAVEKLSRIEERIAKIHNFILSHKKKNIIFVTHGFLLKFLQLYFLSGITDFSKLHLQTYNSTLNFDYGSGFTLTFQDGKNLTLNQIKKRRQFFKFIKEIPYFVGDNGDDASCLTKSKKLAESLSSHGLKPVFYECSFSWNSLGLPEAVTGLLPKNHLSKHVFLKCRIPETGDLVVLDPTWHKSFGKVQDNEWSGYNNTAISVPCKRIKILKNKNGKAISFTELEKKRIDKRKRPFVDALNNIINITT